MKKLIILTAVMVLTTFAAKSQTLPYRPFSQFSNDIGAYLLYNFDKRGDVYTGKTFAELMKNMELKPLEFSPTGAVLQNRANMRERWNKDVSQV